jgi:hypothetical protein
MLLAINPENASNAVLLCLKRNKITLSTDLNIIQKSETISSHVNTIKMKKINLFVLAGILMILSQVSYAQKDSSGIYKTVEDFKNRKLSYAINYKTEKHKIKNSILFNDDKIVIKHNGETYTLLKSNTYGYRSTKGIEFRFIDNKEYKVLNPGEALLI